MIINLIEDNEINSTIKRRLIYLLDLEESNSYTINKLIDLSKSKKLNSDTKEDIVEKLVQTVSGNTVIWEKIDNKYYEILIVNYFIKDFFYAFDNKYINLSMLIANAIYNISPLYLKNNKLCTIYENQEIQTQREVSLEEIDRVKRELGILGE